MDGYGYLQGSNPRVRTVPPDRYRVELRKSADARDVLTHAQVLELLESEEFNTKHGKTIAKTLRERWGVG